MKFPAWSDDLNRIELIDGFSLERAELDEFVIYMSIYMNADLYFWYDWANFMQGQKNEMGETRNLFWIKQGGQRIGGVFIQPGMVVYPFLIPPYTDLYRVLDVLTQANVQWGDPTKKVWAFGIIPTQVETLQKLGYHVQDSFRCMIRPTEAFEVNWGEEFVVRRPEPEDEAELANLFFRAFENALERDTDTLEGWVETVKFFFKISNEVTHEASTLIYDRQTNQLVGACTVSPYYEWPLIRTLAVLPEYRGKGLAQKMLKHALTVTKPHYPAVRLFVTMGNPSQNLYYKLNFLPGPTESRMFKKR